MMLLVGIFPLLFLGGRRPTGRRRRRRRRRVGGWEGKVLVTHGNEAEDEEVNEVLVIGEATGGLGGWVGGWVGG